MKTCLKTPRRFLYILLAFGVGLTACSSNESAKKTLADDKPLVKVEKVSLEDVDQTQEFTATVEANVVNNISPSSPTRIDRILVEVGDRVSKGQKLVQMDQANLKKSKVQLDNLEIEFKRADELYKVGGASKSSWDAAKTQLDVAQTAYKDLVINTQLTSPTDGVVTARNYDNGDMSGNSPIVTVEQITPVKLKINVSESLYTKVSEGMPVTVQLDVYGEEQFNGKVTLKYPTIDPQTRTFPVEIKLENKDQRVRPGMFARVTMNFGAENRVVAPDRAIIKQAGSGDNYVYVYKDGVVSYNKVKLGRRMDTKYEILSGVSDGDEVVITGQNRLNNGMEVQIDTLQ